MATLEKATRMKHLENLFKKYPDVPKEVIFKEDLLREGFTITAKEASVYIPRRETYQLFSWDQSKAQELEDETMAVSLPDLFVLEKGIYHLRPLRARPRLRAGSPYFVRAIEGKLHICDRSTGSPLVEVRPWPTEAKCFSKTFPDGTYYREICGTECHVIVFRQCQFWGKKEECKFCDINENARNKMRLGQVKSIQPKDVEQVAEVIAEIQLREPDATFEYEGHIRHIHLNGGTILGKLQGIDEFEFYLRYVEAIKAKIANRFPIILQTDPWSKEREKEAFKRGANARMSNFEVWDERLFQIICPGKAGLIGRDEWIKRVLDQVDIFGIGNVIPGFVAGVEMAPPFGFKTVDEAVKSTTEGMEFYMSHGVVVRPISWCVEALSDLAGQPPPPTDYFIQIDRNWFEIWVKYNLPAQTALSKVGPGISCYPNSAVFDMGFVS